MGHIVLFGENFTINSCQEDYILIQTIFLLNSLEDIRFLTQGKRNFNYS